MIASRRRRALLGSVVALGLVVGTVAGPRPVTAVAGPRPVTAVAGTQALSAWTGGINLYRSGTFTTQRSWLWCTAAGVQIVRNIVEHERDHSTSGQRAYFRWMRERNRYDLPLSAGVDPQGWTAGLRQFVDDRYRLVSSATFDGALRSAVERLRLTNLPVAITVSHGGHGWIMTGFTATADPAVTKSFRVTSVRVVGPLYGLQSKNGYDMPPNTKLTPTQLKRFFTPWKYEPRRMIWDGRYVSIQPIPAKPAAAPAGSPIPAASPPLATPLPTASPTALATPAPAVVATGSPPPVAEADATAAPTGPHPATGEPTSAAGEPLVAIVLTGLVALGALGAVAVGARSGRRAR